MTTSEPAKIREASLAHDLLHATRRFLGTRRALVILAVIALVGGVALNWSWLVVAGIAPILLTVLPCLVMCGLGLCMHKMGGGSSASLPAPSEDTETAARSSIAPKTVATPNSLLAGVSSCCGATAGTQLPTDQRQTQTPDERRTPHA